MGDFGGDSGFSGGGGEDFSYNTSTTYDNHAISIFSTPLYEGTGFSFSSRIGKGGGRGTFCSVCKVLGALFAVGVLIGIVIIIVSFSTR